MQPLESRRHGFILLVVMWVVALLALLTARITAASHGDVIAARLLAESAKAWALADGAVAATIFRLASGSAEAPSVDGVPHPLRIGASEASVTVTFHGGRVNPSFAPPALMQELLQAVGADDRTAGHLAAAIADWVSAGDLPLPGGAKQAQYRAAGRPYAPSGEAFESLAEVGLVLGMTPDLLARLAPHLSVWTDGSIDSGKADPFVAGAYRAAARGGNIMGFVRFSPQSPAAVRIVEIRAEAGTGRAHAIRTAVVRIVPASGDQPPAWQVLSRD